MDIRVVPKIGISSVVYSKYIDPDDINVVGNDIALFDTESVTSLYNGSGKLEVMNIGLCLEGSTRLDISLCKFELIPGRMVIVLSNQIIGHHQFSSNFRGVFFTVSESLSESLPKVGNVLPFFFFPKDCSYFDLSLHEQEMIKEYHAFIRKRLKNKDDRYRREVVMGLIQGLFSEFCNTFNGYAPDASAIVRSKSRKGYIFERSYESLIRSYQSERSVKFYADQLRLTSKHLSGVAKEVNGKTVGKWIDGSVTLETKALLNSSSMSVREITDRLSLVNQSFFGRYLKHYTGMSPRGYRKSR